MLNKMFKSAGIEQTHTHQSADRMHNFEMILTQTDFF